MMKGLAIKTMKQAGAMGAAPGTLMNSAEDLIARARSGDAEAFHSIFERYSRPVLSFIFDMVGERSLAEELMQETFVRAYRGLGGLRGDSRLSTWLFGIAKNVARESIRSRFTSSSRKVELDDETVRELPDLTPPPDDSLINKELNGVIRDALARLDEDKRLVFTLKVFQQQSYEEISAVTGFTVAKLKTDLHRARAEMRRLIRPYLEVRT